MEPHAVVALFGNASDGDTCSDCGFFSEGKGSGLCHFTGERTKADDEAAGCVGFHVGDWNE